MIASLGICALVVFRCGSTGRLFPPRSAAGARCSSLLSAGDLLWLCSGAGLLGGFFRLGRLLVPAAAVCRRRVTVGRLLAAAADDLLARLLLTAVASIADLVIWGVGFAG